MPPAALEDSSGEQSLSDLVESLEDNPVRTLAETAIRMNPEFELLSTDDAAGTITFRNIETGEEATLNFEDIAEGRFTITTTDGNVAVDATGGSSDGAGGVTFTGPAGQIRLGANVDLGDLPEWVPVYPGSSELPYVTSTPEGQSGMMSGTTVDPTRFSRSEISTKVPWKPMASRLATSPALRAGRPTSDRSRRPVTMAR